MTVENMHDELHKIAAQINEKIPGWLVQNPLTTQAEFTTLSGENIASVIDHTALKPDLSYADIEKLCKEALFWHFGAVCVNLAHLALVKSRLAKSACKAVVVVGFPLGATTAACKAFETKEALALGADEIDMVINIGALKSGDYQLVFQDIKSVVSAAAQKPVKVILETCLLSDDEKIAACLLAKSAGAAFVKTSTGFSKAGATVEDVQLMRMVVGSSLGVKASGGVTSHERALQMIAAGATRLGTSSSIAIVSQKSSSQQSY